MNGLENFEPFDDLEDWSDNIELFMDTTANSSKHANTLWKLAKPKKEKPKLQNNLEIQSLINPRSRSLRG